jgi:hypothetical protein
MARGYDARGPDVPQTRQLTKRPLSSSTTECPRAVHQGHWQPKAGPPGSAARMAFSHC